MGVFGWDYPGVELEPLVYFAASVFWRATAHDWGSAEQRLNFGSRYQEELRQYLLAQAPFPVNAALLIDVSEAETFLEIAAFPFGGKVDGTYYRYEFHIPGVQFTLFLGERIVGAARKRCVVHSSEKWIFLSRETRGFAMALLGKAPTLTVLGVTRRLCRSRVLPLPLVDIPQ
jgi:hypothetical protein